MRLRAWVYAVLLCLAQTAGAYETDQFTQRLAPLTDATDALNQQVNSAIRDIIADWRGGLKEKRFAYAVYRRLGGYHWVDKLERWAMESAQVDRLPIKRYGSIYSGHPIWATRVTKLFGVGPTIKINDQLVGTDKIGHFFSQGKKFYYRYLKHGDEAKAAARSAFTERAIFGQKPTGSYSNADLVANYEGHRFYRSLFEDNIVPGKPAILLKRDGRWVQQRAFDWRDHVNPYWDEALNINHYDRLLYPHMHRRLQTFCPQYEQQPERYDIADEVSLRRKYAFLQLRQTQELRLSQLCRQIGQVKADGRSNE